MRIKEIGVALVALCAAAQACAIDISTHEYFAYRQDPNVGAIALLSHSSCSDKVSAAKGWKKANIKTSPGPGIDMCWTEITDAKYGLQLWMCPAGQNIQINGACIMTARELFLDTASLPRRAGF